MKTATFVAGNTAGRWPNAMGRQARWPLLLWLPLLLVAATTAAQNSFVFDPFTVDAGGPTSTGSTYSISGTAGQSDAGLVTGSPYAIRGGFWHAYTAVHAPAVMLKLAILPGKPMQLLLHGPTNRTVKILASDRLGAQANWTVILTTNSSVTPCVICSLNPTTSPRFFRAMVVEANRPPVLQPIGPKQVTPGQALGFTAVAQDSDAGQTLTFTLDPGAPGGASIGATSGVFDWTPGGVGDYSITVRVTDNGEPPLSDAETIIVTVGVQTNRPPVLTTIGNKTVNEEAALTFTATASDPDAGQTLTFSLGAGYPTGAAISSGGAFSWTPTEAQGPGSYPVTVIVSDNGSPVRSNSETINVTVNEVNKSPVLTAIPDKFVGVNQALAFSATATDPDLPAQTLAFSLVNPPSGATITAEGAFNWTPTVAGVYPIIAKVTDSGSPPLNASNTFTVTVTNANHAPVLNPIGNRLVQAGYEFTIDATATDQDAGQLLTFSLAPGAPAGATIDPSTGHFSWTPPSGGTNTIVVRVTDNGSPPASDEETIIIRVSDKRPALSGPSTSDTGTFNLQWSYAWTGIYGSSTDGYELQESTTSGNAGFATIFSTYNTGDRESPKTFQITARTNGTYWYRVRANDAVWSTWSDVLQVQVAAAAPVLRIVNNLYAGTDVYGNWGLLNNIIRVRIGPSQNAVFTNMVYERLYPYDSTLYVEDALQISPGGSKDFNVAANAPNYYVFVQTGYWGPTWDDYGNWWWEKHFASVVACDGNVYSNNKGNIFVVTAHQVGTLTVNISDFLPQTIWYGSSFCQ